MYKLKKLFNKILSNMPWLDGKFKYYLYTRAAKNYPQDFSGLPEKHQKILQEIYHKGYAVLEGYYDTEWCESCEATIRKVVSDKHDFVKINDDRRIFGVENLSEDFMAFHNDEFFYQLADAYYGKEANIGVTMANWIWYSDEHQFGSGGDWHRDRLRRQFKALVYLTDVTEKTGPFQMIEGSNTNHTKQLYKDAQLIDDRTYCNRLTSEQIDKLTQLQPDRLKTFTARKGTVVLIDTSAIHRGAPVLEDERFAIFNYYYPMVEKNQQWSQEKFSPRVPEGFKA